MKIRSKLDGTVLNAQLQPPAEDINYGNLVLMIDTADGRVALNMVEAQDDYEIVEMTNRYQRLRAPQPWKRTWRMFPLIFAVIFIQVFLFLGMMWYFRTHR